MNAPRLLPLAAALCLAACGGGGADSTPPGPPAPTPSLTISPSEVNLTADTSTQGAQFATVNLTAINITGTVYLGGTFSHKGLSQVTGSPVDASHFTLSLQFRDAPTLAPGTYTDTINLHLCSDQACAHLISATQSIAVHYTVTGNALPQPQVNAGTAAITEQTLSFVTAPMASIPLTFDNITSLRVLDQSTTTNNAIYSLSYWGPGGSTGSMGINFKAGLPIGTYHDAVTLAFCNNDTTACQQTVIGSGATVTVTLTVSDTITGAYGYTAKFATVTTGSLAWDAQRQVIYAATASTDPAFPQAVAVIDPASATVTASTPLAGGPGALAVSGDGAYLYAGQDANGTVSRLSLPALATDLTLTLPTDSLVNGPLRALDIEVAPGNAHEVAIAVGRPPAYTPNCHSLMLLQDAQLLAELPGNGWDTAPCVGSIQWGATSSVLYTDDIGAFPGNLYRVAVDAHGMSSSVMVRGSDFLYMGPIQYRSGLLYTAGGAVYDPVGGTLLGQLPKPVNALLRGVFSPETHRVIAVDEFVQGLDGIRITALDTNTFTELAHIDLPGLHAQVWSGIRWGADGYALALTDGRVLLLNGAFVGP